MATVTAPVFKKLPGVLAFQRGLVISDAELFSEIKGDYESYPVEVVRHGIRGTQNVNTSGSDDTATSGDTKHRAVSNIQQTDSAKLASDAEAMIARFSIRFLDLKDALFACAPGKDDGKKETQDSRDQEVTALRDSISGFVQRAKEAAGIDEIACRIARNIANGRWLWRNRLIASAIEIVVESQTKELARFEDALKISLLEFGNYSEAEQAVAHVIADGLRGRNVAALTVVARLEFGFRGAIEVFPSQNYIEDKPKGFARSLYRLGQPSEKSKPEDGPRVMGRAAIRDQKVSNALRTIDTWYPDFEKYGRPIPVEPNGANLDAQHFFRNQKGFSAFDMVRRLNQIDPATPDGMFLTACLIRGGVYSEGS
jgi:CRISPR-associated protein Csy3